MIIFFIQNSGLTLMIRMILMKISLKRKIEVNNSIKIQNLKKKPELIQYTFENCKTQREI